MKYLLDTHTLLWFLLLPEKLSATVTKILTDSGNEIYVSVISFWEISLKHSLGKLQLIKIKPEEILDSCEKTGIKILPLSEIDAISFYELPNLNHKDPFDRMLVWQATRRNLILLTADKSLLLYKDLGLKISW